MLVTNIQTGISPFDRHLQIVETSNRDAIRTHTSHLARANKILPVITAFSVYA